jgi:predicted PurR-regulated permease PerM
MDGVTTAIVFYIFFAVAFPALAKNKPQFYAAFAAVLGVIFLDALSHAFGSEGFERFAYFMAAMLQICAVILLVLSAGGLSVKEFKGELLETIEVIRRGESEKEVIVPLRGQKPVVKEEEPRKVYKIDESAVAPEPKKPAEPKPDQHGPLPLS